MNTEISRDVIMDLLPVYLSGEASADTRTLIDTYMKQNPEFARTIRTESKVVFPRLDGSSLTEDREMAALRRTKRLLHRRAWHLGLAILFSGLAFSFQFGPEGIKWTWQESPPLAVASGIIGIVFWILYFRSRRDLRGTGV